MIHLYQDGKLAIRVLLSAIFVLALAGYSLFQVNKIMTGPTIDLAMPDKGFISNVNKITLKGTAANVAFISLNDNPIYIDENGLFSENLLLNPGYNVVKLYGKDKFGKSLTRLVEITYKP